MDKVTGPMPTRFGDVIILVSSKAGSTHLVCPVATDAQQGGTADRHTVLGLAAAEDKARSLVVPAGRIFLRDQDSGEWKELRK